MSPAARDRPAAVGDVPPGEPARDDPGRCSSWRPHRQPRRTSRCGRSRPAGGGPGRGRGHAPYASAAGARYGSRTGWSATTPAKPAPRGRGAARPTRCRRGRGARHRCRDAGGQRPGKRPGSPWADGGRQRRCRSPGRRRSLAAVSATGIPGPRWSFEGFLPRSGP